MRAGESTVAQRVALLTEHRKAVVERMAELPRDFARIDDKIAAYVS